MKDFFDNISRYPRYFISFTLGVFLNAAQPLVPLLKQPTTEISLICAVVASLLFLSFTLRAMLGLG